MYISGMKQDSVTILLLKALIPYTRENISLTFKPAKFFADLERAYGRSRRSFSRTYKRAKETGLITNDPIPRLTAKGFLKVAPFAAVKLDKEAKLMIIFDIPEHSALVRRRLRRLLKILRFTQVQKSVWITEYDHRDVLRQAIEEMDLVDYVEIYECAKLPIQNKSPYFGPIGPF